MTTSFLHGIEVVNIDDGARPIQIVDTSVIGIVGTAPNADASVFPLNTPVLVTSDTLRAKLDTLGTMLGTLPSAMEDIFKIVGAAVVVIRVNKETTDAATLANVVGGIDSSTGAYKGVQAFLAAQSVLGVKPKLLIAPGFTHQRTTGGVLTLTGADGSGYTDGTYNLTVTGGTGGSGAAATAVVQGGSVVSRTITNPGSAYTAAPTFALPAGAGSGTGATFVATLGTVGNAVVSALTGIADRMRAVIFADGPNTNDTDAIAYAGDFGSKRVYVVDPMALKLDASGNIITTYSSSLAAALQAKSDNERGFWWSVSNQEIPGIIGTARAIDFALGDANCRANILNKNKIATIIRENGYRLWGNRSLSSDAKWQYLCVVRTADTIADSLQAAHLWAVDRGITKTYMQDVREGVKRFLRSLVAKGAILGGDCWIDPELNTPDQIAQGNVYWDFDFTPTYPAEHLTFRSHLVDNYIKALF